jgi:hypothetical protein
MEKCIFRKISFEKRREANAAAKNNVDDKCNNVENTANECSRKENYV